MKKVRIPDITSLSDSDSSDSLGAPERRSMGLSGGCWTGWFFFVVVIQNNRVMDGSEWRRRGSVIVG